MVHCWHTGHLVAFPVAPALSFSGVLLFVGFAGMDADCDDHSTAEDALQCKHTPE